MKTSVLNRISLIVVLISFLSGSTAYAGKTNDPSHSNARIASEFTRVMGVVAGFAGAHNAFRGNLRWALPLTYAGVGAQFLAYKISKGLGQNKTPGMSDSASVSSSPVKRELLSSPSNESSAAQPFSGSAR